MQAGVGALDDVLPGKTRDHSEPRPPQKIFVEITRSERFQPIILQHTPITISALPLRTLRHCRRS
jgi:hypothetical protein